MTTWEWILLITVVIYVGYEIFCLATGRPTLTMTIRSMAQEYPELILVVGLLMGHFFWT